MPMTTFLMDEEHLEPTSNRDINDYLQELRGMTGEDWRVAERKVLVPWWGFFKTVVKTYTLYFRLAANEFQVINLYPGSNFDRVVDAHRVVNYILGYSAGYRTARRLATSHHEAVTTP